MAYEEAIIPSRNNEKMSMLCPKVTRSHRRGLNYKLQNNFDPYVWRKVYTKGKQKGQKSMKFSKNMNKIL